MLQCYRLKQQTVISVLEELHVVCLFTLRDSLQYTENNWLHGMTDFNKIHYRPVIEFYRASAH